MNNNILIYLVVLLIVYYFIHSNTVCDGESDCALYNNEDKISACDPICEKQGKIYKSYSNGHCECENIVHLKQPDEHTAISKAMPFIANIELYTNLTDSTTVLPSNTPDDLPFNNRDILQKHEKDRYSSLIFG